ncbi:MAG: beta-lactamase family protein [Verrucomicrobia bacterium]|nr:beta-lactamase family protein [Verrucomicrobiota bacterium]
MPAGNCLNNRATAAFDGSFTGKISKRKLSANQMMPWNVQQGVQDHINENKKITSLLKPIRSLVFLPTRGGLALRNGTLAQFILGLVFLSQGQAQTLNRSLHDNFIRLYNGTNNRALFTLGTPDWQHRHNVEEIGGWLDWMRSQTGRLLSSVVISNANSYQFIRLDGERKVTGLMLQDGGDGQFGDFNFVPFTEPLSAQELKTIHSDNPLATPLDLAVHKVVTKFMVYNKPVGLSIGVIRDGKPHAYNYGTIEKGRQQLPTADSFYEIGSLIKTFAGRLLAKAVIDHKVNLQDDVQSLLGSDYSNLQHDGQPLRLVHLASYTSRLPPYQILRPFDESTPKTAAAFFKDYSIPLFLEDVKRVKLDGTPGTRYSYSTAGFNLLAYILSRVYEKPFADLVHARITAPLGMRDTKLDLSTKDRRRFPKGYDSKGVEQPDIYGPLDGLDLLHSTVHDMLKYLQDNIAEKDPAVRLSHEQFSNMPHNEAGLGWFLYQTPLGKAIGKGGNSVHMNCRLWAVPERKAGLVCFTNVNDCDWGTLVEDVMAVLCLQ